MNRNHFRYLEYKSIYAWCCCVYCNSFYDPIKNAFIFIFHQVRLQGTTEKSVQLYVTQIAITRPRSNAQKARITMVVRNNLSARQREEATIMLSVRGIATKSAREIQIHANNPQMRMVALPKMPVSLNKSIIMAITATNNIAN